MDSAPYFQLYTYNEKARQGIIYIKGRMIDEREDKM
jgi:hypothetical protein